MLDEAPVEALVEMVAAESGRIGALLAGDLPHTLVEHADEAGVELLPYGGELGDDLHLRGWLDPCPHALAVLYQVAWLVDADPLVLLQLRGLPRDDLLARLHARTRGPDEADDVDRALDAALRAARVLELLEDPSSRSSTSSECGSARVRAARGGPTMRCGRTRGSPGPAGTRTAGGGRAGRRAWRGRSR